MQIREQRPGDYDGVQRLYLEAFPSPSEAQLVDALYDGRYVQHAWVAIRGDEVAGQVLFTPVTLDYREQPDNLLALGPMAVRPRWQGRGIGSALVEAGLAACEADGTGAVFVLGHPAFYPRFGFLPTVSLGIHCESPVPREAFMVRLLQRDCLKDQTGTVRYVQPFVAHF